MRPSAAAAADAFPDGITWVALASLRDPAHAVTALAQALEVLEEPDRPLLETLTEHLAGSPRADAVSATRATRPT